MQASLRIAKFCHLNGGEHCEMKCLAQEHKAFPRPEIETQSYVHDSSILITKPCTSAQMKLVWDQQLSNSIMGPQKFWVGIWHAGRLLGGRDTHTLAFVKAHL